MSNDAAIRAAMLELFRAIDGSSPYEGTFVHVWSAPPKQHSEPGTHLWLAGEVDNRSEQSFRRTEGSIDHIWVAYHKSGDPEQSAGAIDVAVADMERALATAPTLGITAVLRVRMTKVEKDRGSELDGGAFALVTIETTYRFEHGNP